MVTYHSHSKFIIYIVVYSMGLEKCVMTYFHHKESYRVFLLLLKSSQSFRVMRAPNKETEGLEKWNTGRVRETLLLTKNTTRTLHAAAQRGSGLCSHVWPQSQRGKFSSFVIFSRFIYYFSYGFCFQTFLHWLHHKLCGFHASSFAQAFPLKM